MKIYAMDSGFLSRLLADRRELFSVARSLGTAESMRDARADLIASARVFVTPKAGEAPKLFIDADGAAHIPIVGELTPSAQTDACGAYTAEALTEYGFISAALAAAESNDAVSSIALDIDSPGGYVSGVDAVAQAIASASKPTTAYIGDMAASAAYWLASQADRIVAMSPASRVGSIGVAAEEYDDRAALEAEGVAHRVYTSTDAPDKRPDTATDEGRAKVIAELDDLHAVFVRRVAEGRHVSAKKVSADFGKGGVVIADKALAAGMIDDVLGGHFNRPSAGVASSVSASTAEPIPSEEVHSMDLTQLKAEHPDVYAAAKLDGVNEERNRRNELAAFRGVNPDGDRAVEEAIASDKATASAMPTIMAAIAKGKSPSADGENAPAITAATPATGSGVLAITGMTAEDIAALRAAGLTDAEIKANAPKGKE